MKELVLFYSYSGNTRKIAQEFAGENKFDICEVSDVKRPGKLSAYTAGIVKAINGGGNKINPLAINNADVRFGDYSVINIFAPIWAGHPAPAMNSALKLIPAETKVKLFMVSMSAESGKDRIVKRVQNLGLEVTGYEDVKS
jgi:menaquinone-dependent protoporphyrinogen IX oxidase